MASERYKKMKKTFKFVLIALLFVAVVAVPLLGVRFNNVGYNKDSKEWTSDWMTLVPSVFDENSILANMQFGGGSAVYLTYDSEDEKINSADNLEKGAKILEERFQARGFADAKATVEEGKIRIDFAQKTYLDSVIQSFGSIGDWSFVGSDMTKVLCDESYVEGASVTANPQGGYAVSIEFTKKGAEEFYANTASYAISGSYFYLMLDGQMAAYANLTDSSVKETFTFGQYDYENAAAIASFIKTGPLPEAIKVVNVEELEPTLGTGLLAVIYGVIAVLFLGAIVAFFLIGKKAGVFATLAFVADAAILLTAMLSSSIQLNFITLITMVVLMILAGLAYVAALRPIGAAFKEKAQLSASTLASLSKFNTRFIAIHAVVFFATLICFLFGTGNFMYVVRITMLFSAANAALYFLLFYFGVHTLTTRD